MNYIVCLMLAVSSFSAFTTPSETASAFSPDIWLNGDSSDQEQLLVNVGFEMTGEWHPCSSDEFSDIPKPGMKPTANGRHYHKIGVMAEKAHGRSAMRMCVTVRKTKGF